MKTRNYRAFYKLLSEHSKISGIAVADLKEQVAADFSGGRTTSASELSDIEFAATIGSLTAQLASLRSANIDFWRELAVKALKNYHSLMGYYADSTEKEREEKAKGAAVKARGKVRADGTRATFNDLSILDLQTLYYGTCKRNKVQRAMNETFKNDLKKDAK